MYYTCSGHTSGVLILGVHWNWLRVSIKLLLEHVTVGLPFAV